MPVSDNAEVFHQDPPHGFHRIGKTISIYSIPGDITADGGISGLFCPAVVLQPPHGDGVYPPALIFLPVNRNLIHLHRLALFTG